jgi:hypothetical protein
VVAQQVSFQQDLNFFLESERAPAAESHDNEAEMYQGILSWSGGLGLRLGMKEWYLGQETPQESPARLLNKAAYSVK